MKLYTYHTPERTPANELPICAIAIDVLRATSTIAAALKSGAEAIQAFSNMDMLMEVSDKWPSELRLRGGERGGAKVVGCDLGNSPLDCTPEVVGGKRLFISTTNGTRTLQRIQDAKIVLAAALVNRQAIVDYVIAQEPETVWMVGSGWEGDYSLEDSVCAGAIADSIITKLNVPLSDVAGNDELVASIALYRQWKDNLLDLFYLASHGQRLVRLECFADLKFCATPDTLDIIPIQTSVGVLQAHSH
ncbi:2-phosphosulfolactate phosphatase family protein [Chamaesiphon minutus]|uniref:Probable 2-phosphosulfolactate phosphatase n=1 Tax=Chamaesiphon minutus (strain ATCC 27169 / PCC 6605) TaxID=1173020 RepID=K9UM25_CHAP6|nr:2-phosphosulfolactate phosphatase family protein [Chamaesiphon minutus]AFY95855.1 phosphosulfolactate phosphohydrolase-like enzyme [Chamaesiphon minutus PCC 6605]